MKSSLPLLLLALAAAPVWAADHPMTTPGLWEISVQMQMSGMPYAMPPRTVQQCVTQQMLDRNKGVPDPQTRPGSQCKLDGVQHSGGTTKWAMTCSGETPMHGEGSMTYDSASAYHGEMHLVMDMHGRQTEMTQTMQGKRIGDCH